MNEVPLLLQFIAILVAIAGGIALPFVLFILADMRGRISTLFALVNKLQSEYAAINAQLAILVVETDGRKNRRNKP